MATSLPLARGFFNASASRPSEDQRREYIEFAESSIRKVFALSDCHRNSWIPVREKKGVAVFRNFGAARGGQAHKSNIAEVGGKSEVQASLDEVARAYAAHDDALFSRLMKKLNGAVMDAAVVATIVPRSPLAPFRYIGIKWFAVKTPTPLVSHRDYCCLEVQDKIVDGYGNEMYIRILNSIEIKECPSLENSHGLVRAKMLAGSMYRTDRAEPTLVRIHHVARFDPAGYFPSQWAYKTAESQLVSSVVQIKRVVEKQQMNACTFVDKKQWVPNHERQHCAVCSRQFGTFRPRHHCRCCGEVICGKCSIFKSVDVPGTTLKNVRICSICNMGVQKARPQAHSSGDSQLDDAMSDISTSSVTSSSTIAHNEMNLMDLYLSGPPGTPSAYSTASAQSNLSMRSTTSSSSRSFGMDGRAHRGNSGGSSTPGVARFFKGGSSSSRSAYNIFSSSAHTSAASLTSSTTPAGRLPPGALFNETNTPRSYLGGGLTPHRMHTQGNASGFGTGSNSAASTPRAAASGGDASDAEDHERRKSVYKQNPLDLGYLRESVRVQKLTDTALSAANDTTNNDGDDAMQGSAEDVPAATTATSDAVNADVKAETKVEAEAETKTGAEAEAVATSVSDVTTTLAVTIPMAVTIPDSAPLPVEEAEAPSTTVETVTETEVASSVSTTPRRLRGESGTLLLPPAKMPRVEDDDVEMEDAANDNQQEESEAETAAHPIESIAEDTNQKTSVADVPMVSTAINSIHADKSVDYEMDEPIIRSNATSTSTAESSTLTASAVEPPIAATPETPRKSFLGGLFSRASLETKPTAA